MKLTCMSRSHEDKSIGLLTLGVAKVIVVVSPEVVTRRKYQLDRNDHVNNFGMYSVRSLIQCSALVISTLVIITYGCWSLSVSLGGFTQDVPILITEHNFRVYLHSPNEVACDKAPK